MNVKENVTVGNPRVAGALFIGATPDATLPTDATTALGSAFHPLGYASEDGVTLGEEGDKNEVKAWGGDVVRTDTTGYYEKATFTLIETNIEVARLVYGADNVVETEADGNKQVTIKHTGKQLPRLPLVIETVAGDGIIKRYVAPSAQLVERGDISLNGTDSDGRELTFNLYLDAEGVSIYEYNAIATPKARGGRR